MEIDTVQRPNQQQDLRPSAQSDHQPGQRILSVDYFRGLAVFLMLVYDYVPFFTRNVPLILQHGRGDKLLFGDLVAPFFLFIMGFSLALSVKKRRASGNTESDIFRHVLVRSILLVAIGLFIDVTRGLIISGELAFGWGVLETLGLSYLFSYFVLRFRYLGAQLLIISISLGIHLILSNFSPGYQNILTSSAHGGPFSMLAWAPIAAVGTICGIRFIQNRPGFKVFLAKVGTAAILIGIAMSIINPLTKKFVTSSYAIFSSGASALFFLLIYYLVEDKKQAVVIRLLKPLREFGISALLAWALQYIVAVYFIYYFHKYGKLPAYLGIPLTFAMIFVVWIIVREANRRNIRIKI